MQIEKNSRQMPSNKETTKEKDYCDLLYAWLQCNSTTLGSKTGERRIPKKMVKWTTIERDFTRFIEGKEVKAIARKTIAKYFAWLEDNGFVELRDDDYYYLTTLDKHDAFLVEYNTLSILMNTLQRRSLSIYIYLLNRYIANGYDEYIVTMNQIKEYIGATTSTSSNNVFIIDTFEILTRLGLMEYKLVHENDRYFYTIKWVKNRLSNIDFYGQNGVV